jgi:hypothetical protein
MIWYISPANPARVETSVPSAFIKDVWNPNWYPHAGHVCNPFSAASVLISCGSGIPDHRLLSNDMSDVQYKQLFPTSREIIM